MITDTPVSDFISDINVMEYHVQLFLRFGLANGGSASDVSLSLSSTSYETLIRVWPRDNAATNNLYSWAVPWFTGCARNSAKQTIGDRLKDNISLFGG